MTLPQKTFDQLVQDQVTAWAAELNVTPVLPDGDMLLAIFQGTGSQMDFLQALIQLVNALSRASTSEGDDLDSFYAQFNFPRLGADAAEGPVVFSKNQPAATQVLIAPGTVVQTTGGAITYTVIADTNQSTWSPVANAYVLAVGQSSLTATVEATVAGSASNVTAGQLTQIGSDLTGIDSVTNPANITNGNDAEQDSAYRARFPLYLTSLQKATEAAILSAALAVQQGITVELLENENPAGQTLLGSFTAVVDNGTGSPGSTLLSSIYNAVYAARAFTVQPFVTGPNIVAPAIALAVRVATGYTSENVVAQVQAAVVASVNMLAFGATLYIAADIEEAALGVAGVVSVQPGHTTINGAQTDLTSTTLQAIRVSNSNVSVGTY